jgi:hypothetical protein
MWGREGGGTKTTINCKKGGSPPRRHHGGERRGEVASSLSPSHKGRVCAGGKLSGLRLLALIHLFGVPKWHPSKERDGDGAKA